MRCVFANVCNPVVSLTNTHPNVFHRPHHRSPNDLYLRLEMEKLALAVHEKHAIHLNTSTLSSELETPRSIILNVCGLPNRLKTSAPPPCRRARHETTAEEEDDDDDDDDEEPFCNIAV